MQIIRHKCAQVLRNKGFMKLPLLLLSAFALCIALASGVQAAVLGTYTHDYGRTAGRVAPDEFGRLRNDHVLVENSAGGATDFADSIDLSGIGTVGTDVTVDSIELDLVFDRAGPNPNISENWFVEISGAGAGLGASTFALLNDDNSPQTITLAAGSDAFAAALAGLSLEFTFIEPGTGRRDTFRLFAATVRVNGSVIAAVPLPAPGLMLLMALGGLAFMRRKPATKDTPPQT